MNNATLYGLVLCGGKSSRMGQDKSLLNYHGVAQRDYLFSLLERFCARVYTSCKPQQDIPAHLNPLPDTLSVYGPINGILTALRTHTDVAWLVIAVDMPFIDAEAIRRLLAQRNTDAVATCIKSPEDGFPEPLFTVWETSAHSSLEAFVAAGGVSPRKFLAHHHAHLITAHDPRVVTNINTPQDRQRLSDQ